MAARSAENARLTALGRALARAWRRRLACAEVTATPHPASVELLAYAGEVDGASRMAARLPAATPWDRFERILISAWRDWLQSGRVRRR